MKAFHFFVVLILLGSLFFDCDMAETIFKTPEKSKLAPPLGLRAESQNGKVTLFWFDSNYEEEFQDYYIFQASGDLTDQTSDSSPLSFLRKYSH